MSFPLGELAELLGGRTAASGVVVEVMQDGQARVASRSGGLTVRTLDALAVGERVLIRNGLATRAQVALRAYPV